MASYECLSIPPMGMTHLGKVAPPALQYISWTSQVSTTGQGWELQRQVTLVHAATVPAFKFWGFFVLFFKSLSKDSALWWLILTWVFVTMVFGHHIISKYSQRLSNIRSLNSLLINCHFRWWHYTQYRNLGKVKLSIASTTIKKNLIINNIHLWLKILFLLSLNYW